MKKQLLEDRIRFREVVADYMSGTVHSKIDPFIKKYLTAYPSDWMAYRLVGDVLEKQGDITSATDCYLADMPINIQKRIFEPLGEGVQVSDWEADVIPVHKKTRKMPRSKSIESTSRIKSYAESELESEETYLQIYKESTLWYDGLNSFVMSKDGVVSQGSIEGNLYPAYAASLQAEAIKSEYPVVLMGSRGSNNYYHWMLDILPKFAILENSGIKLPPGTRYVFLNVTSEFQKQTLTDFGLDDESIYTTSKNSCLIESPLLIIPKLKNSMGLSMGQWLPRFMKKKYFSRNGLRRNKKILITRDKKASHGRAVDNVDEFNDYFCDKGFERLSPEKLTVADQAEIFQRATHVVGLHGAGLTNIVFSPVGTKVYELYGEHLAPCYWAISELSDLEYKNHNCAVLSKSPSDDFQKAKSLSRRRSSGFSIPVDDLDHRYFECDM